MQYSSVAHSDLETRTKSTLLQLFLENLPVFLLVIVLTIAVLVVWITRPASDALIAAFIGFVALVSWGMLDAIYFEPRNERETRARKEEEEKKKTAELKSQLRKAIYSEMGRVYGETKANVQYLKMNVKNSPRSASYELSEQGIVPSKSYKDTIANWNPAIESYFDLYNSVRIGDPSVFYQLSDPKAIDTFYSLLKDVLVGIRDSEKTVERTINDIEFAFFLVEWGLWTGGLELDLELLRDCTPTPFTHRVNELIILADSLLPTQILKQRRTNPGVMRFLASNDAEVTVRTFTYKRKDFNLDDFVKPFNDAFLRVQKGECTLIDAFVRGLEAIPKATWRFYAPSEPQDLLLVALSSLMLDQLPLQYVISDLEQKWINSAQLNLSYSAIDKTTNERQTHDSTLSHFASIYDATNYFDELDKTGCVPQKIDPVQITLHQVVTGRAPTVFKHYVKIPDVGDLNRGGWILQNDDVVTETYTTLL
jgi:hypothetical protein